MNDTYIRKEDLNRWVAKYFKGDLISIDELIGCIEELDSDVEHYKEELETLKQDVEENYMPKYRNKYEEYGISEKDFY